MCDINKIEDIDEHHWKVISGSGDQSWFYDDFIEHRLDGPAVERRMWNGTAWVTHKEWWYMGKKIDCSTQEDFERIIKLKIFW